MPNKETNHAAAGQSDATQTIVTDTEGLVAGRIDIPTADGKIPGYRARPATGGPAPVVLIVHEIFGLHAYIQDLCRRLAKFGYLAIAPDLYQRQLIGVRHHFNPHIQNGFRPTLVVVEVLKSSHGQESRKSLPGGVDLERVRTRGAGTIAHDAE